MPSDGRRGDRKDNVPADNSAVRLVQAECSRLHALQASASASRELPFAATATVFIESSFL